MIKINNSAVGEKCTVPCKHVEFIGPRNCSHKSLRKVKPWKI